MAKEAKKQKLSDNKILSLANNDFTHHLYKALVPGWSSKNVIFSPFSVHAALGMVGLGAEDATRSELIEGLSFDEDMSNDTIGAAYKSVISGFQQASGQNSFTLLTANKVYCRSGFRLDNSFVKSLKDHFMVNFEQLNFDSAAGRTKAAATINKWVATTTKNNIQNLVDSKAFNDKTRLVLVNAIYFKGLWESPFSVSRTKKVKFHVTPKKDVEVNMMRKDSCFAYRKLANLKAAAVCLPYKGGRLSMIIVLPDAVDGLNKVQDKIGTLIEDGKSIVSRNSWSSRTIVELSLPRFKIESTIGNLTDVLKNMGMELMFKEGEADFSGIPHEDEKDEWDLWVSSVVQKALIEVNEEGAKAVAATRVVVSGKYMTCSVRRPPPKIIPFVVDHPFYFQIVDHANGDLVLFSGHCNDPTK